MANWIKLLDEAFTIIDDVNRNEMILPTEAWSFGGGTAIMLQIKHRNSDDIDIFVTNPQILQMIAASVSELQTYRKSMDFSGDGCRHLRVTYSGTGEIDFIVSAYMTDDFAINKVLNGRTVQVETVTEIIAKKVVKRGSAFQYRDFFDLAAVCESGFRKSIVCEMAEFPEKVKAVLDRIGTLNQEFFVEKLADLNIHSEFEHLIPYTLEIAKGALQESLSYSNSANFAP